MGPEPFRVSWGVPIFFGGIEAHLAITTMIIAIFFAALSAIQMPYPGLLRRDGWMLVAPTLLFLYYLIAWLRIGPEPKSGAMVARYDPPEGLSPAAARYIAFGTTDGRSFAAVIAQLAIRKCIRVESENGKYKLSRLMSDRLTESALAAEEKRTLVLLFEDGPVIELSASMDDHTTARNGRYIFHIHEELAKQLGSKYFTRHAVIISLGVLFTFLSALPLAAIARGRVGPVAVFITFWILFCGLVVGLAIEVAYLANWRAVVRAGKGWVKLFPLTLAVGVFAGIISYFLIKLAAGGALSLAIMLASFLLINLGWGPQLRRKTPLGRQASDQISGFRQFLLKVEQDRLNRLGAPGDAPQELALHLPYAIALEVKQEWGDHLAQAFIASAIFTEG